MLGLKRNRRWRSFWASGVALLPIVGSLATLCHVAADDHFESKVRPAIVANCLHCHGEEKQKGGLRLDSREAILRGGDSGPALVIGKSQDSLLIQVVSGKHADLKMPPSGPLPAYEIQALKRWVNDGAVWPRSTVQKLGAEKEMSVRQQQHWSWQPIETPAVPDVPAPWRANPIDAFLFDEYRAKGLTPVGLANKRTLIRRATFDLIGLPPTPADVDSFLRDDSPSAFERMIERLLASRHYGERWGRHWLDLARYADTAGDAADFPVPEAYKYRNYVIDAFNDDKRFDEFIREQIAGDLLPFDDDEQRWRQTVATGYLAISRRIGVSPQNLRHITIEDTIDNLGKTFLGLTVGCARCHDHKFDPIPTSDYYSLYGIFDSSVYPHAGAEHKPYRENFVYRIGNQEANKILAPYRKALQPWDKKERDKLAEYRLSQTVKIDDPTRTREVLWQELLDVREQRREYAEAFPDLEIGYAIQDGEPGDVHVQIAGDPGAKSRGPLVRRGFLKILGGQKLSAESTGSGRRELAEWIADANNPLTARVIVNRIWHHHFGRGLVTTTSDFGIRGAAPSHPELLDFLARRFMSQGWSIKEMHRLIMSSRAYRLRSSDVPANDKIDPSNEFMWRFHRRRLDAEQVRDAVLMLSGRLDLSPADRHPFPHHLTYFYRQHEPFQERYTSKRRSVYLMQQRIQKNPFLDLFDGPDGNLHLGQRRATTTSLQSLYMMNSPFMEEQSKAIATRLVAVSSETGRRVEWAYENVFGRPADRHEVARGKDFVRDSREQFVALGSRDDRLAWAGYVRAMLGSNEFMFVD